jgi:hypothetical protein
VTNAANVDELGGAFTNFGASGGEVWPVVGFDVNMGKGSNGQITGYTASLGYGFKGNLPFPALELYTNVTYTWLWPFRGKLP